MNSNGGMLFLSGCSFLGNEAEDGAPAVWSHDSLGIDGGGNCGSDNLILSTLSRGVGGGGCDGIYFRNTGLCQIFAGGLCGN